MARSAHSPALLLLRRSDRLPVRTGRMVREPPGPLQEQRRRPIVAGGKGELLGRAGEIARTIAGQALGIGLRARQQVRRDLRRAAPAARKSAPPGCGP